MDIKDIIKDTDKLRIIQELVPGKQITLAHVIANPDPIMYHKLGLNPETDYIGACYRKPRPDYVQQART